ncbi:unnamed protein product [Linum tenue]|uniref:Uncharacterized protein n=1 Tax=Linum tenue TaxID=586396 RepID=A0AAV0LS16_9ROSI|nr:unnamed protein product [Linum tenue]
MSRGGRNTGFLPRDPTPTYPFDQYNTLASSILQGAGLNPNLSSAGGIRKPSTAAAQNIEKRLRAHIIGQEEAVKAVARAVRRASAGVSDPSRPVASFLFTGPTGCGKTELANALAIEFFGSKQSLIRLDMSEYMERHNVAKLFGSPTGYIGSQQGGQLTEAIKKEPNSVVLFDEIEKAHSDVWNALLQILDYGTMTDGRGQKFDFGGAIVVLTSNVGQGAVIQGIPNDDEAAARAQVMKELKGTFKPELLNRLDEIVIFRPLAPEDLNKIIEIMLKKLADRMKSGKGIRLQVAEGLKAKIAKEGYDPSYGARPLKRAIIRLVEDPLAEAILDGRVKNGGAITLFPDGDEGSHKRPLCLDDDEEEEARKRRREKKAKGIVDPSKKTEIIELD